MSNVNVPYRPTNNDFRSVAGVMNNFDAVADVVNGNLDNANLDSAAALVDSKLWSPNNSAARLIATATGCRTAAHGASSGNVVKMVPTVKGELWSAAPPGTGDSFAARAPQIWHIANADYAVPGKLTRFRILAEDMTMWPSGSGSYTAIIGMAPVTVAGTAGNLHLTIGAMMQMYDPPIEVADGFYMPVYEITAGAPSGYSGVIPYASWNLYVVNL